MTKSLIAFTLIFVIPAHAETIANSESGFAYSYESSSPTGGACSMTSKELIFRANNLPRVPAAGSAAVWGGNAMQGEEFVNGKAVLYTSEYLALLRTARARGLENFAYFEGKCGLTDGQDDGEIAKCHKKRPNWDTTGWKEFTFDQLKESGRLGIHHCEVDNIPPSQLMGFLRSYQQLYTSGQIACRLVLKNVGKSLLGRIATAFPDEAARNFISPFAIFENDANDGGSGLDQAFHNLKGPRSIQVISSDSKNYGSAFRPRQVAACR